MASFTNFATLSYNGGTTNSNTVTGELLEALTVTKTAVVKNYAANDKITYIISIVNSGAQPVTNLTVTDNLGAYEFNRGTVYPLAYVPNSVRYYVNGVLQTAPTATPEPPLVITVPNVPANGSIMLVYEAEVTAYAPLGTDGSITNTANVTDGNLEVSASETVSTEDRAVLTISKALCPAVVTGNGQITYTFVIENTGNTEASEAERIVLTDTFDPILKNIAVTFNGTAWTAGTQYTYGETTGVFATLPGQITVPAAQYTQNENGTWATTPGTAEVIITGTV